jgi:hypothetical protein
LTFGLGLKPVLPNGCVTTTWNGSIAFTKSPGGGDE